MRAVGVLAVIVVLLAAALAWQRLGPTGEHAAAGAAGGRIGITSVHDGDTFRIGSERIRIIGMDTPEIGSRAGCAVEQAAAERARDFLRGQLMSGNVEIIRDGNDVYGRTLAYVRIDGRDIADTMLENGLARPYTPGRHPDWCGG
jgi:endonuclease YncB( thermonuclease family)